MELARGRSFSRGKGIVHTKETRGELREKKIKK